MRKRDRSRPARGVLVEIATVYLGKVKGVVTSRKGRVSRNVFIHNRIPSFIVTSRKGRVSRNTFSGAVTAEYDGSRPARGV